MIVIDPSARVSKLADVEDSVRGTKIIIGPRVVIDAFVKIKPAGGMGDLTIGEDSYINSGTVIYTGNGVQIGRQVLIAANCTLASTNHSYSRADVPIMQQGFLPSRGGITIEDDVWIGANCVLLDGAILRRGAVVAAGSVVRGELASYGVYGGNPPAKLGQRS
jgi:acetyltransferase-like isoleucine patch superfamily enzyme